MAIVFQDATIDIIYTYDLNHSRLISETVFLCTEYSKIASAEWLCRGILDVR